MRLVVQKFGGTSVGDPQRIGRVAEIVSRKRKEGHDVVVVVSAMSGETDRLLALSRSYSEYPPQREVDQLLASGEQVTASLLCMALFSLGHSAVSLQGFQVPIRTDLHYGTAQIQFIAPQRIRRHLREGAIVVITGFQGVTEDGDITTLGRGGSDLTAVAVAAAVDAEVCEIYTDVRGVFTADPNVCPDARPIEVVSYDEMLEMASLGAKVLQARSVQLAKRYRVPLHVLSTFELDGKGTLVKEEEGTMEGTVVSAVTCDRKESRISVRGLEGGIETYARLFSALADAEIIVDVIVQDQDEAGRTNITFTVPREQYKQALEVMNQIAKSKRDVSVLSLERVAKVSAVGLGMKTHSGVAARIFRVMAKEGVEVQAISTSDIKVSCVIDDKYAELVVRALHEEFGLAKEPN